MNLWEMQECCNAFKHVQSIFLFIFYTFIECFSICFKYFVASSTYLILFFKNGTVPIWYIFKTDMFQPISKSKSNLRILLCIRLTSLVISINITCFLFVLVILIYQHCILYSEFHSIAAGINRTICNSE